MSSCSLHKRGIVALCFFMLALLPGYGRDDAAASGKRRNATPFAFTRPVAVLGIRG
jgi:hypothetical protein